MFAMMTKRSLALATMLSVAALSGCSKPEAKPSGDVRVAVGGQALVQADATTMTLTISDNGVAPAFSPIVQAMTKNSAGAWSGYVTGIPAGLRKFNVDAFDAALVKIYSGQTTATVTAGGTANVYLMLQQVAAPNSFGNHAPVIDALTTSASTVVPGGTVALSVAAHDPDTTADAANHISGYLWEADAGCGAFDNAASQTPVWTAPTGADATCNIRVTVSDVCPPVGGQPAPTTCSSSVTATIQLQVRTPQNGSAQVNAYPNTCPVVMCVHGAQAFTYDANGAVNGYTAPITVEAVDVDGDDLKLTYSSVPCPGAQFDAEAPFAAGTGVNPTPEVSSKSAFFTANTTVACATRVDVKDYWPANTPPAGSGLDPFRGCTNTGLLTFGGAVDVKRAPEVVRLNQPNAQNQVNPGQAYTFGADLRDPNGAPVNGFNGYPLAYTWTANNGGVLSATTGTLAAAGTISVVWTAPASIQAGTTLKLVVTNALGLTAEHTFTIIPANACAAAGAEGTACDDGNACTQTDTCQAGACVGANPVTCTASACHTAACSPSTGACVETATSGGTCNDGSVCTTGDICQAGTCAGVAVPAPTPATCQVVSATCDAVAGWTLSPAADGAACTDGSACTSGDACLAGACAGTPVPAPTAPTCQVVSATCNPASGWTFSPAADGSACSDGLACTQTDVCLAGACAGANPVVCGAGACLEPSGTCGAPPAPSALALVEEGASLGSALGLAYDETGAVYQGGNMFQPGFDFGCGLVNSTGGSDIFAAKLDPTSARCAAGGFSVGFGDAANDQSINGLAVNRTTLAVIGQFNGALLTGTNSGATIDYVALGNRASGLTTLVPVDLNEPVAAPTAFGKLNAIAGGLTTATIGADHFAVCGYASLRKPAIVTDPAAVIGGGADVVVAVLDNTGAVVWGRQFGGTGDQICNAVAFDDAGDVVITGTHAGVMNIPGATLAQPTGTNRWSFVAKFDGATGATKAAVNIGTATGTSRSTPRAITVDASGNVIVAGQFQAGMSFPTTPAATVLAGTGSSLDVFVAKFNGTTLAPLWAHRLGGTAADDARAVGVDTYGQVYLAGVFASTTTATWGGPTVLTATGAGNDAFMARLDGTTGTANYAGAYGDANGQEAVTMVVTRLAAGVQQNSVWMTGNYVNQITFPGLPALSSGNTVETRKFVVKLK